jgi:predicted N-acetyltransferase YhbS
MKNIPKYEDFLNESSITYTIKEIDKDEFTVYAKMSNKIVGELRLIKSKFKPVLKGGTISVDPNFRRKGIASSMYVFAEEELGMKFVKSDDVLTPDGKALWDSPNRKFGMK